MSKNKTFKAMGVTLGSAGGLVIVVLGVIGSWVRWGNSSPATRADSVPQIIQVVSDAGRTAAEPAKPEPVGAASPKTQPAPPSTPQRGTDPDVDLFEKLIGPWRNQSPTSTPVNVK